MRERHAAAAFHGEGAAKYGGRWNSRGVPMVYTSATLSLAALETLVHLNPPMPFRYLAFRITFADGLVEEVAAKHLPADWQTSPPPPSTRAIGDVWVREARSAVLAVPSVLVPSEWNYVLNPAHSGFRKIAIGKSLPFAYDPRLLG